MRRLPSSSVSLLRRVVVVLVGAAVLQGVVATAAGAQGGAGVEGIEESEAVVDILPIEGFLDPPAAGAIRDVVEQADERGSSLVVVQLDSRGSISADLDELVEVIRASAVPVAVLIGPRGADAEAGGSAALVMLAAHVRVMSSDAMLGPIDPADLGNASGTLDDPSRLAPGLVEDPELLEGVLRGRIGAAEADDRGLVDLVAEGLEPLLTELDGRTVETAAGTTTLRLRTDEVGVRFHSLGLVRRVLHAATTPVFIYLLLTVGLALLLFEVFQPGFGVAGLAGVITAAIGVFGLTVLPVSWWAVALLVLGLVLFAVDTAIAGLGWLTAAATASFGAGSWWLYDSPSIELSTWVVAGTTLAAVIFFVVVMTVVLRAQAPPDEAAVEDLVGRVGMVRSMLNPEGHVYIDDALWRARWTGESKRAGVGTPVEVTGVDGPVVLVEAFDPEAATAGRSEAGA